MEIVKTEKSVSRRTTIAQELLYEFVILKQYPLWLIKRVTGLKAERIKAIASGQTDAEAFTKLLMMKIFDDKQRLAEAPALSSIMKWESHYDYHNISF